MGLRPEAFEDAALVDQGKAGSGTTFGVDIDVIESLGSDVYAYFTEDEWQPTETSELAELAADSGITDTGAGGHQIVARLNAATRVREGGRAQLWVDTAHMHVFDPASGANLARSDDPVD